MVGGGFGGGGLGGFGGIGRLVFEARRALRESEGTTCLTRGLLVISDSASGNIISIITIIISIINTNIMIKSCLLYMTDERAARIAEK